LRSRSSCGPAVLVVAPFSPPRLTRANAIPTLHMPRGARPPREECGGCSPHFFVPLIPPRRNVSDELEDVITTELDAIGYDLVELRRGGTRSRPVIEVRIDRRDGEKVSVDDCARVSRSIEARLDAGNVVSDRYVLQVSSPGDRPLKTPADWRRFVGRWVNVLSPAQGGRFEGQLVAVEEAEGSESAVLELEKGRRKIIPLADVKEARLAFHW